MIAPPELTEKEMLVLQGLTRGDTQAAMAYRLHVSQRRIEDIVQAIKEKFEAPSSTNAVAKAVKFRVVDPDNE